MSHYLIDSNAVIDYLGNKMPFVGMDFMDTVINEIPKISIISKIEVLGFMPVDQHLELVKDFLNVSIVLPLNQEVADFAIALKQQIKIKTPDAIIAATAIVFDLTLITRNNKDFERISGLQVLNPHSL